MENEVMNLTRMELLTLLNVTDNNLKQIIKRKSLKDRLKEKGYLYKGKKKYGRNSIYIVERTDYADIVKDFDFSNGTKFYEQLKINQNEFNNHGIYYILNKNSNEIYIGSTITRYRERFRQHMTKRDSMKYTYNLLHSGGEFHILHDMTNIQDEKLVRMVENEYIKYFKEYTDYNVINHSNEASWKGKNYNEYKSLRGIKVKKSDYENIINLLKDYGYIL